MWVSGIITNTLLYKNHTAKVTTLEFYHDKLEYKFRYNAKCDWQLDEPAFTAALLTKKVGMHTVWFTL